MKPMFSVIVRKTAMNRKTTMSRHLRNAALVVASLMLALAVSTPAAWAASTPPPHAAITISSDADFQNCACVTSGSGTATSPYVIGPWTITGPSSGGWAVKVDNSNGTVTKFFKISGISIGYNDINHDDPLIWIVKVTQATVISSLTANQDGTGVRLDSVANVSMDNIVVNLMNGLGVIVNASTNVSIVNSKLKAFDGGFDAEDSSFIQIGANCKSTCNEFTYDDGRGLWLHNTHDVTVRYLTTAAEDTTAMYLDGAGTYNVDIGFSTANSSGSICPQGQGPTGLHVDTDGGLRLVNGAHDNYIHDLTAHGNVAMDIASGGDGFWLNPCTGVQEPISPATSPMGANNRFANLCYSLTNIAGLPPSSCKN